MSVLPEGLPRALRSSRLPLSALRPADLYDTGEHASGRALIRVQKLRMKLGGSANMAEPFPLKPRSMHWKTYRKLKARHDRLTGVAYGGLSAKLDRLKDRMRSGRQ